MHRDGEPGFGISFPDFPGCISEGDTIDETIQRGATALALHIEGMLQDGENIPAPRSLQEIEKDPSMAEWRTGAAICFVPTDD
ncbi:MAG: type II toxin-antitoxin system HicB family antitoxin [Deltaproteobacteria bacterium]|nr:type II toxin-antitoxin system HicB family antitoxin [Deltaproteobacteria bacterium]